MNGFKKFLLQGDLVALATAVIIATAFGKVVSTFTEWLTGLMPESADDIFDKSSDFGAFLNAVVAFVIVAAVVYFFVIVPYTHAKQRFFPDPEPGQTELDVLKDIRAQLAAK